MIERIRGNKEEKKRRRGIGGRNEGRKEKTKQRAEDEKRGRGGLGGG